MVVFEAIKERRSFRACAEELVSEENVERLVEASGWDLTAGNVQPWAFVVARDVDTKRGLPVATPDQTFIQKAPVVIIFCADLPRPSRVYDILGENLYSIQDAAAAVENILLIAQNLGLATCWVGEFWENKVAGVTKLLKNMKTITIISVGYPAESPEISQKRFIDEIIDYKAF